MIGEDVKLRSGKKENNNDSRKAKG